MLVYLIRRLGQSLLVVAVMATLVFVAMFAVGDPVDILASPDADQFERDAIAKRLGLDRPLYDQFGLFVWRALHGDLGRSFVSRSSCSACRRRSSSRSSGSPSRS